MDKPNIDSLFQTTAPRTDWKPPGPPLRPSPPGFDDQLWQMTAPPIRPGLVERPNIGTSRPDAASPDGPLDLGGWLRSDPSPGGRTPAHDTNRDTGPKPPSTNDSSTSAAQCQRDDVDRRAGDEDETGRSSDEETNAASSAAGSVRNSATSPGHEAGWGEKSSVGSEAAGHVNDGDGHGRPNKTSRAKNGAGDKDAAKASTNLSLADANSDAKGDAAVAATVATIAEPAKAATEEAQASAQATAKENLASTTANANAANEAGENENAGIAAAQQRGKASRAAGASSSSVNDAVADKQVAADSHAAKGEAATAASAKAASAEKQLEDDDDAGDERSRSHGKDANSRGAQRTSTTADAQSPAAGIVNVDPTPGNDASASATDETGPRAVRDAGSRVDGSQSPLAKGPRGDQAAAAKESNESSQLNRVDTARFVGRVARAFHFAQERGGTLQLRLSPPELGSLRLELSVKDGALTANLETETQSAKRLLLDNLPALRERLAEQNVRVERFDVDVRRDGQGGQSTSSFQQQAEQQQSQQATPHRQRLPKTPVVESAAPVAAVTAATAGGTGINLVV